MESLSPWRRAYYAYLGRTYALIRQIQRRSILGVRLLTLVRWLPAIVLLYGWLTQWPASILVILAALVLWINLSLWRAKRANYIRFVPDQASSIDLTSVDMVPANQKIPVEATGLFSVSGYEGTVLLRPASYWRVPLGDHVVMVEERPGKFLYQFFGTQTLQEVRTGWLLHGPNPIETVSVTFLVRWGPEYTQFGQAYENGDDGNLPPAKRVTIYLSTADMGIKRSIWHSIASDIDLANPGGERVNVRANS